MQIVLIIIGVLLIVFNIRFIDEQNKSWFSSIKKRDQDHSNHFAEVLKNKEMDTTDTDVKIAELRREFAETILELQKETVNLSEKVDLILEMQASATTVMEVPVEQIEVEAVEGNNDFERNSFSKAEQVVMLIEEGYSIDDVCKNLDMGRGEVLLIKKLYSK